MGDDPMALLGLEGALKHYYYYYMRQQQQQQAMFSMTWIASHHMVAHLTVSRII
jgi:hypothetical protein